MNHSLSRRSFLKKSGLGLAVAASSYILPSNVIFGKDAPSNRLNIALIGCGGRMDGLCKEYLLKQRKARVIATCDPFKPRREDFANRFNTEYGGDYCKAVEDFRDVLSNPDIDGIVVATPDHWHVPIAIAAARAGKDMYVEKPLGLSMSRAALLKNEIRKNGRIFQYGTQQHSSLSGRQAIELIQNGYVGKITHCDVWCPALSPDIHHPLEKEPVSPDINFDLWLGPARKTDFSHARVKNMGAWHCYDYALGFIAGWGAHPLDMLQWGLNLEHTSPVTYEGTGYYPTEPELYDTIRTWDVQMQYENGVEVRFRNELAAETEIKKFHPYFKPNGVIWYGTDGYVVHSRGATYVNRKGKYERLNKIDFDSFRKKAVYSPEHMENFIDSMISRKDPVSPIEAAINSDAMSHLVNVAVRSDKKIKYNPKTLKITNEPELNSIMNRPMRAEYAV